MPPLAEFTPFLEEIWRTRRVTNGGPYHDELEVQLATHLEVPKVSLFTNGTIALIAALRALDIKGEVITTPYSFVATSHALLWQGITPVFVDIDPDSMNLDPDQIEAAITDHTTAILAVHCYGRPCDMHRINRIAKNYGLKVIYDAAHAFGVKFQGSSIMTHGDLSVLSFHATKVFHTFEGGAVVCKDEAIKLTIDRIKNFGFVDEITVTRTGINGKMSEINAAFGILQLRHISETIRARAAIDAAYRISLAGISGIHIPSSPLEQEANYGYFPIRVGRKYPLTRDELYEKLRANGIHCRRYFYPLITDMPMYRNLPSADPCNLPVAKQVASEIICLPIYPDLESRSVHLIAEIISSLACTEQKRPTIF